MRKITRDVRKSGHYMHRYPTANAKNTRAVKISFGKGGKPRSAQDNKYNIYDKFEYESERFYRTRDNISTFASLLGDFALLLKTFVEHNVEEEFEDGVLVHGSFMPLFMACPVYTQGIAKCYNDKKITRDHEDLYSNAKTVYNFIKAESSRFFNHSLKFLNKVVGFEIVEKLTNNDVRNRFKKNVEIGTYLYVKKETWENFKNNEYMRHILSCNNIYEDNLNEIYKSFHAFSEAYAEYNNGLLPREMFSFYKYNSQRVRNGLEPIDFEEYLKTKQEEDRKAKEKRDIRVRTKNMSLTSKDIERDENCVEDRVFLKSYQGNTLRLTSKYSCVPKVDRPKQYPGYIGVDIHAAMPRLAYMISHEDYEAYDGDFYEDIAKRISGSDTLENFTGEVRKRFKNEVVKSMNISNGHYTGRQMYDTECRYLNRVEHNKPVSDDLVKERKTLNKLFKNLNIPFDSSLDSYLKFTTSIFDEVKKICGNKRYGWFYNVLESKINLLMAEKLKGEFFHINYDEYAVKDFTYEQIIDKYIESVQTIVKEAKLENKPLNLDDAIHHALFEPTPINKSTLCVDDDINTFEKYKDKSAVVIRQYKDYCVGMHIDDNVYYAIKGKAKDMQKMLSEIYDVDAVIATNIKGADKPLKNFIYSVQCKNIAVELNKGLCDDTTYDNLYIVEY